MDNKALIPLQSPLACMSDDSAGCDFLAYLDKISGVLGVSLR